MLANWDAELTLGNRDAHFENFLITLYLLFVQRRPSLLYFNSRANTPWAYDTKLNLEQKHYVDMTFAFPFWPHLVYTEACMKFYKDFRIQGLIRGLAS